jgi:hypothetical protein
LDNVIREIEAKGVAFLAHPLINAQSGGKEGSDVVPYSELSLDMAWKSPAILGLQFWNENDRLKSDPERVANTRVTRTTSGSPQ